MSMQKGMIAAVFLAVVLLFGGFFFLQQEKNMNDTDDVALPASPAPAVTKSTSGDPVVTQDMEQAFRSYVAQHYPGWKVESTKYDPMCDGAEAYDVTLSNAKKEVQAIILSRDGKLLQTEKDAEFATAPVVLQQALKQGFQKYSFGDSYEQITMANGESRYLVDVTDEVQKKTGEVIFSQEGKVLCQTELK